MAFTREKRRQKREKTKLAQKFPHLGVPSTPNLLRHKELHEKRSELVEKKRKEVEDSEDFGLSE